MRILHVFKTYLPDGFAGVEHVIFEIAEGAARHGVQSDVFYLSDRRREGEPISAHRIHSARTTVDWKSTPIALNAWGHFRALAAQADLIHYHFPWPMMDLLHLFAGGRARPSVVTYHSDIVKQATLDRFYAPLRNRFLASVDAIVATSPNYLATSPVLQTFRKKSRIIPIGIEPAQPQPTPEDTAWAATLPERFFLFVGALRYYKGLPYLLEAARLTSIPVILAGAGDPPADLPPNVTLVGPVSDSRKAALLSRAEAFVFPSHLRSEAFGVALLEAAFAGLPLISCEIGTGTTYVNIDGETGLAVPPADPAALSRAMQRLWDDEPLRQRMGFAARTRAHAHFTADRMVEAYLALYREVLGRSRPPSSS